VPPARKPIPLTVLVKPARRSRDPSAENDGPFAKLNAKLNPVSPTVIPWSNRVTGVCTTVPWGIVNRPSPTGASSIARVVVVVGGAVVVVVCAVVVVVVGATVVVVVGASVVVVVGASVVVVVGASVVVVVEDVVVDDDVEDDVEDDVVGVGADVVTELFVLSSESSASVPLPSALRLTW
jgi:hypothetical protein